ncbi:hypothetical protein KY337_05825, partial [Candidatus Woesearchaeota archaeon]|nr:hypothetical protein [Candidatus Woesearchaeota archaeon]
MKKGVKNIITGVGFSKDEDPYKAAKKASRDAIKNLKGKKPNLSLIFYSGEYDPKKLNKGVLEVLKGTEFVGGSTDAVIFKDKLFPKGVVVASIYSEYMHFGVASVDNISKNPYKLAQKTILQAVKKIPMDRYLDSYMAFQRSKKNDLASLIRIPSFFVLAFTRGFQANKMGNEDTIVKGISDATGNYVPIFGGSLGNDMDKVFNNTPYDIISMHSGKLMKDGLLTVFACTGVTYSNSIEHGGYPQNKLGYISEVKNNGFVVTKVCDEDVISWYAKMIGVSRKEFTSKLLYYTQKYPLGFPDGYGNIVMRAGGVPYKRWLMYIAPFKENTPVFVMNTGDKKKVLKTVDILKTDIKKHLKSNLKPAFSFLVSCSSRRRVLKNEAVKEIGMLENFT